ncbi:hypothetical protein JW758_02905 [Candidatus Peregrinibacteria bacterium]|nr:hypothetical protein [Candidatus Peregrinibacteria bacterium]
MKKLLFILPTLLLLSACSGEMKSEPENTNNNEATQEETINTNNETSSQEKINENEEATSTEVQDSESQEEATEEFSEKNNKREYDCHVPCGKAETDTDGVISEKECLAICHSGVETCENKIEIGEMEESLFDLCCTGELIKEIKNRYPDLNLDPK